MTLRLTTFLLAVAMLGAFVLAPLAADAKPATAAVPVDVTGTTADGGTFAGVLTLTQVVSDSGNLVGVGTLTGTLTDATGATAPVTAVPITTPLAASGTCDILHLVLGPLDLDLLGLQVHLNQVVLDITAASGSGNLLGNLLCAVAHLLDSNASGNALANLLTRILSLLG